jgi:hypothetical protein
MIYRLMIVLALLLVSCSPQSQNIMPQPSAQLVVSPPNPSPTPPPPPIMPSAPPKNREVTVWTIAADGSLWYAFDELDVGIPDFPDLGLYRLRENQISHYEVPGAIRALEATPDGSLYVGVGCGVLRYDSGEWDTLANPDCTSFARLLMPVDIAVTDNGDVWVAGIWGSARYDGEIWTTYNINATRLLVAPDGSLWTEGWDGRANSNCCFAHFVNNTWMTYTLSATAPISMEIKP